MSKLLIAGFKGTNNSSKVLLDMTNLQDKLYLENDKQKSCEQIKNVLDYQNFNCIFLLGQKPIIKNKISIELTARRGFERLKTDFDIDYLTDKINN